MKWVIVGSTYLKYEKNNSENQVHGYFDSLKHKVSIMSFELALSEHDKTLFTKF